MRVLVLGGTRAGRVLADRLGGAGHEVTSSLAGRTSQPLLPAGRVRSGGFGGVDGLVEWLAQHRIEAIVDATHPFAETMHRHTFEASELSGVPMLHLTRPSWRERPEQGDWTWVDGHAAAAEAAGRLGGRVLLTVGRQNLADYHRLGRVVARVAEDDGRDHPSGWELLVTRGPFSAASERDLLGRVDVLVSKDSGGNEGVAKLDAAAELGVGVVMIERPGLPGPAVSDADEVLGWLTRL